VREIPDEVDLAVVAVPPAAIGAVLDDCMAKGVKGLVVLTAGFGETGAAGRLEQAVAKVIADGRSVTYDLKPRRDDPSAVGTREMADAIISAYQSAPKARV
jgi:L-asparaginase/Glu-tRNA(Gln) amidotransferase subunit D